MEVRSIGFIVLLPWEGKLRKRWSERFGHSTLTDSDVLAGGGTAGQTFYNRALEKTVAITDIPHVFVLRRNIGSSRMPEVESKEKRVGLHSGLFSHFSTTVVAAKANIVGPSRKNSPNCEGQAKTCQSDAAPK